VTTWNIDPHGVQGVCTRTVEVLKGFEGDSKSYGTNMTSAATGCGKGGGTGQLSAVMVLAALGGFNEKNKEALADVVNRGMSSVNGAVNATKAYIHGDNKMAAEAQHNAAQAAAAQAPPPGRWSK
jgi:hypothetical protein